MKGLFSDPGLEKKKREKEVHALVSRWTGLNFAGEQAGPDDFRENGGDMSMDDRPIEPESGRSRGGGILRWIVVVVLIGLTIISYYRAPILTALGSYLILEHPMERADLIVITPGAPVEQGLMAAELYKRGMAPKVFVPAEPPPDGLKTLREAGGRYPAAGELLVGVLTDLSVPVSVITLGRDPVESIHQEAEQLRETALEKGYRTMIVVTYPTGARRIFLVFEKVFEGTGIRIMMAPSRYSGLRPDNWWHHSRYVRRVVFEWQRLLYEMIENV
ncbi:MAG: hypothetical protein JRJ71_12585 [Deltaproteobacteria bacterium]|nr:hypothetical protein [Deltaproteobacteria bacterium]